MPECHITWHCVYVYDEHQENSNNTRVVSLPKYFMYIVLYFSYTMKLNK